MARSVGLAHVVHQPDGTYVGVWATYLLRTAFQPIFAFEDGRLNLVAFEGLLRPSRNDESVSPAVFFGLIAPIDRMHVETLSRTLHLLNAGRFLDPAAQVFVNFDPSIFSDRELTEAALRDMKLVLHESGISPERIVCEMTEQRSASEASLFSFVQSLRAHGFRIAVDDYGAEDSDIHRIERLKPDIVKFDAKWITTLMNSGPGFALLAEMVGKFADQGILTVFEGIEHGWQIELAEACGATMVQGFAVARPLIVPATYPAPQRHVPQSPDPSADTTDTRAPANPPTAPQRPGRAFGRRGATSTDAK